MLGSRVDEARRQAVDRMFRARLSWTLLGGVGLLGLTAGLNIGIRGALLGMAIATFIWLNQPLAMWMLGARSAGDPRWKPMAIGMVLRVVALATVIAFSW